MSFLGRLLQAFLSLTVAAFMTIEILRERDYSLAGESTVKSQLSNKCRRAHWLLSGSVESRGPCICASLFQMTALT